MIKALVQTEGNFQFVDPTNRQVVSAFRASVVFVTQFIQTKIASGALRILVSPLPSDLTDEGFKVMLDELGSIERVLLRISPDQASFKDSEDD